MLKIDFNKENGEIRRINGVNLAPRISCDAVYDFNSPFEALNPPIARFHDVPLDSPGARLVDINQIFANWHADAADPRNYYFEQTDDYLANCRNLGTDLHYRLGPSIECSKKKYFIAPPDNYDKWIEICENIIRHYNEGWNNGFTWGIKHWTIWEEPENQSLWGGTQEEYHELFKRTIKRLKNRFPDIKLGTCIGNHLPEPWMSNFLSFCRDENVEMDFFGWSCYKGVLEEILAWPGEIRKKLDEYGFVGTELHVAEWNYTNPEMGWSGREPDESPIGCYGYDAAAFAAAALTGWQDSPVSMAHYYTASILMGLIDKYGIPKKIYYGFLAFGEIVKYKHRVAASSDLEGVKILAGVNSNNQGAILLSAFKSKDNTLNIAINGADTDEIEVLRVDQDLNLEPVAFRHEDKSIVLDKEPGSAIFLIKGFKINMENNND